MKLSDFIFPDTNAARSINLERDKKDASFLEDYQITGKAHEILERFHAGLNGEKISAWSLTGPYGMGKSAFANYLISLTSPKSYSLAKTAQNKLINADASFAQDLISAIYEASNDKGFFHIPVTAAYEPINRTLISGVINAINNGYIDNKEKDKIKGVAKKTNRLLKDGLLSDSQSIIECVKDLRNALGRPIMFIIDEFGKNLEYMAHHPNKGDIFIMQLLAETQHLFVWVCLHQSFEGYASGLTAQQRQEWNKVQGRYEDISFIESPSQMLSMMKKVVRKHPDDKIEKRVRSWAEEIKRQADSENLSHQIDFTSEEIFSFYPFHPLTAKIFPELCRRFAQNDRTLFSFLCSHDPAAFPAFLKRNAITDQLPCLGPDYLYDFFLSVSSNAFIYRPEAQRWFEIHDIIEQARSFSSISQSILKTVGVLNLISGSFGFPATPEVIRFALQATLGLSKKQIDEEISRLVDRKILIYRAYAKEYRLWEGSDFDIISAIREKKSSLAMRPLAETLEKTIHRPPMIASRHSFQTGTTRCFKCQWMAMEEICRNTPDVEPEFDGLIIYSFGNSPEITEAPETCRDGKPLVIVYAPYENQIKELVLESAATRALLESAPELVHDGVARRETRFRSQAAMDQLIEYVENIFSPCSEDTQWLANGLPHQVKSYRELSFVLSDLCNALYSQCPHIDNEMINCDKISPAAARARRELAEAMVTREGWEDLGLSGNGPEVALFRSLFLSKGLYTDKYGEWQFIKPNAERHPGVTSVWQVIDDLLLNSQGNREGVSVADIIAQLNMPPFGLRKGVIPLFLCHYLVVNIDEIAVYQEGAYQPYFEDAEVSLMIKRPDLFSIRQYVSTEPGREIVKTYMQAINTNALKLDPSARNPSLLKIVTPLLRFVEDLPRFTKNTHRISVPAQKLRNTLSNTREPIELIFEEIPGSLGVEPLRDDEKPSKEWKEALRYKLQTALLELNGAFGQLVEDIQNHIMKVFDADPKKPLKEFREKIQREVVSIKEQCQDKDLRPVLDAFVRDCDEDEWIKGIAGQIIKKPVDAWKDSDIEPFKTMMVDMAERIEHLKALDEEGLKPADENSVVITVTKSDGQKKRKAVSLKDIDKKKIRESYEDIFSQPKDVRLAIWAILTESIEKNEMED